MRLINVWPGILTQSAALKISSIQKAKDTRNKKSKDNRNVKSGKINQNKGRIHCKKIILENDEFRFPIMKMMAAKYIRNSTPNQINKILTYCLFQLRFLYNILSGMRIEFVMKVGEASIKVQASSDVDFYGGLPHMECVGGFWFQDVDSGQSLGSASRHYQDCQQIMLLAQTRDQIDLAYSALEWIQRNNSRAWERMNWNTTQVGRPQDFERHQESERQEEQSDHSQENNQSEQDSDSQEKSQEKANHSDCKEGGKKVNKKSSLTSKKQSKIHLLTKIETLPKEETKFTKKQASVKQDKYTDKLRKRNKAQRD